MLNIIKTIAASCLLLAHMVAFAQAGRDGQTGGLPLEQRLSHYDKLFELMGAPSLAGKTLPLDVELAKDYQSGKTKRVALLTFSDRSFEHNVSIGTGGDVYSWKLDGQEMQSPQDHWFSQWVDEVFQVVMTRRGEGRKRKTGGWRHDDPFFIHQAGAYADRRFKGRSNYYSPVLAVEFERSTNALYILSWPQQAHVPENLRSDFLMISRISRASPSFLAIDVLVLNQSREELDWVNFPWGGVRHSIFDQPNSWRANGGAKKLPFNHFKERSRLVGRDNTGVFLWTEKKRSGLAGALVYANNTWRNGRKRRAVLRYGYGGGTHGWKQRNLFVTTAVGSVRFSPGDVMHVRYYLGFGGQNKVEKQLRKNRFSGRMTVQSSKNLRLAPGRRQALKACTPVRESEALSTSRGWQGGAARPISYSWLTKGGGYPVFLFDDKPRRSGAFVSSDIYFGAQKGHLRIGARQPFLKKQPIYRLLGFSPKPVAAAYCPQYVE